MWRSTVYNVTSTNAMARKKAVFVLTDVWEDFGDWGHCSVAMDSQYMPRAALVVGWRLQSHKITQPVNFHPPFNSFVTWWVRTCANRHIHVSLVITSRLILEGSCSGSHVQIHPTKRKRGVPFGVLATDGRTRDRSEQRRPQRQLKSFATMTTTLGSAQFSSKWLLPHGTVFRLFRAGALTDETKTRTEQSF